MPLTSVPICMPTGMRMCTTSVKPRGDAKIANDVFPSEKSLLLKGFVLILDRTYFRAPSWGSGYP